MKLDHAVYFTHKTPEEVVSEQCLLGNHVVVGGRHEKWGTRNALMYVKNAYIEYLSIEKMDVAKEVDHPLTKLLLHDLATREGWGTICLSVENIDLFNEEVENKGFKTSGVLAAERRTEDGELRKWKMLFVDQPLSNELPYPFFIEWDEPEEVRLANLRKDGTLIEESEQKEVKECVFYVEDSLLETAEWAILLSRKVGDSDQIELDNVVLRFVQKESKLDRLAEVIMGQTEL
jgi:hypothetical protein